MFTGGSQFAFVGVDRRRRTGGRAGGDRVLGSARGPQRRVRHADVARSSARASGAARPRRSSPSTSPPPSRSRRRRRARASSDSGSPASGIYIGWNLSTLAGALLGDVLGDPRAYGLDAAAAAAFLALLWPRLRRRQAIVVGGRRRRGRDRAHAGADAGPSGAHRRRGGRRRRMVQLAGLAARARMQNRTTFRSGRACRDPVDSRARGIHRLRRAEDGRLPDPAALRRGAAARAHRGPADRRPAGGARRGPDARRRAVGRRGRPRAGGAGRRRPAAAAGAVPRRGRRGRGSWPHSCGCGAGRPDRTAR